MLLKSFLHKKPLVLLAHDSAKIAVYKMLSSRSKDKHLQSLQEFYDGKSIFLTGATGFIGAVLLEILLRSCPGIKSIYILIRPKKNVQPEERKELIFEKKIFDKIKEENPELLRKVHVISGDASLDNLGMSEEDVEILIKEVSVVFHCAAIVNFIKPMSFIIKNNVLSLSSIIELCKQIRKFEALVYTSTAWSNCNHLNAVVKEEVYRLPFHAKKFLDALKNGDNKNFQELVGYCKPDWPNAYTFSKCLGENVIMDIASDIPTAIIRPSSVFCTWKQPLPGYIEGNSGIAAITLGVGKGFVKVLHADPNTKMNLIPVDIVANAHVLAAWSVGTKRSESPQVVNCTATDNLHVKISEFIKTMSELNGEFPLPQSFDQQSILRIEPNRYLYYIVAVYKHYIPAVVLDVLLKVLGKKPKIFSLYRFLDTVMSSLNFFMFHTFEYEKNNLEYLDKLIYPEDRKDLSLDFSDATLYEIAQTIPSASPFYDWKIDRRSQTERQKIKFRRHLLICCIQGMFLMICCSLIYWMFSFILR